jgi:hypothetical protein
MDMPENKGKTTLDCVQLLFTEMKHLKLSLPEPLQVDQVFYTKLIQACQDLLVCGYTCYKLTNDILGLIEELQTFITTRLAMVQSSPDCDLFWRLFKKARLYGPTLLDCSLVPKILDQTIWCGLFMT